MKNRILLKYLILIIVLVISYLSLYSQTGGIKGIVKYKKTNEILAYASIKIEFNGEKYIETTTDIDGFYIIKSVSPGNYDLKASYNGYVFYVKKKIEIKSGTITKNNIIIIDRPKYDSIKVKGGFVKSVKIKKQKIIDIESITSLQT